MSFFSDVWSSPVGDSEFKSATLVDQCDCERECAPFLLPISSQSNDVLKQLLEKEFVSSSGQVRLLRKQHVMYLTKALSSNLPGGFVSLDASRPWICYWILHALNLLDSEVHR